MTIEGSNLQAGYGMGISTDTLNITASQDTHRESTKEQSGNITVSQTVHGANTGPSVNASLNQNKSQSSSLTHNNSTLTSQVLLVDVTGDANIAGATIHATEQLDITIGGDLNLVSQQNTSSGSNHGIGMSGGVGSDEGNINSANAGINSSNGRYYTSETVQTSLTSGGNANVTVNGNTHLEGALLATMDENGQDSGQLSLSTESLSYRDLSNSHYDSNQSMGLSSNVGIGSAPATTDDPLANIDTKNQSSSMQYSNTSSTSLGKTLATLGEGDITIGGESQAGDSDLLAGLNRDTQNTEKELYSVDRQQGNVDVTVDHRLATGNFEAIGDDIDKTIENVEVGYDYLTGPSAEAVQTQGDSVSAELNDKLSLNNATLNVTEVVEVVDVPIKIEEVIGVVGVPDSIAAPVMVLENTEIEVYPGREYEDVPTDVDVIEMRDKANKEAEFNNFVDEMTDFVDKQTHENREEFKKDLKNAIETTGDVGLVYKPAALVSTALGFVDVLLHSDDVANEGAGFYMAEVIGALVEKKLSPVVKVIPTY